MREEITVREDNLEYLGRVILELVLKNSNTNKYYKVDSNEYSKDSLIAIAKEYIEKHEKIDSSKLIERYNEDWFDKLSNIVDYCTRSYNDNYLYNSKEDVFYKAFMLSNMAKLLIENKITPFCVESNSKGDYIDIKINEVNIEIRVFISRYIVEVVGNSYLLKTKEEALEKVKELIDEDK